MKRAVATVVTALVLVTAGCTAGPGAGSPVASAGNGATSSDIGDSGTVNFYVSDEPNDMDDFEHLNVTITTVRFHLVDAADNGSTDVNGTETQAEADERDAVDSRWVTREVNATSIDLSALRGANATLLEEFDLPAGEYDKVFLDVSEVDGTLTSGESANVKLPSEKLQLTKQFAVENGSNVDFVYDVSVHKAGKSGKYILKPVVSESGTDVPIEEVGDEREDEDERDDDSDEGTDDAERSIDASFVGNVSVGENATVRVTENGSAVENATVSVDDGPTGTTDADGEYVVAVPADAEELEVEVESGDAEAELKVELEGDDESDPDDGDANSLKN